MDTVIVHFGEGEKKDFVVFTADPGRLPIKKEIQEYHIDILTSPEPIKAISEFITASISRGMKIFVSKNKDHVLTIDSEVLKAIKIAYFDACQDHMASFIHQLKFYLTKGKE